MKNIPKYRYKPNNNFVENGTDVNVRGGYDAETAAELASRKGYTGIVEYLTKHGAK